MNKFLQFTGVVIIALVVGLVIAYNYYGGEVLGIDESRSTVYGMLAFAIVAGILDFLMFPPKKNAEEDL